MDDLDLLRDTPPDLDRVRGTELELGIRKQLPNSLPFRHLAFHCFPAIRSNFGLSPDGKMEIVVEFQRRKRWGTDPFGSENSISVEKMRGHSASYCLNGR